MPTIKKLPKKKRINYSKFSFNRQHTRYYNMNHNVRELYYSNHPLCELSILENKVVPAEHIHHIFPFSNGKTEEEKIWLATNENNLISLSKDMHLNVHNHIERLTNKQRDYLTNKYKKVEADLVLFRFNQNKMEYR